LEYRALGRSSLTIAPLVLGTNVFGWTVDEKTAFAILDAFVDAGFNAVDTANSYSRWLPGHSGGESESIIGNWVRRSGKRGKLVIATKVGSDMGDGKTVRKAAILKEAEASLKRLRVDTIDLYQTHFDDEVTPVEETLGAYAQLIAQGKARAIGASNISPERLEASLAASKRDGLPRYETLQPNYNLYDRAGFERDYAAICRDNGIAVIPYYGLAGGFLTGKYRSAADAAKNAARGGKVKGYLNGRGLAILKAMDGIAARHKATPAQIALAWLMAKVTAPIASATSLDQLGDIMAASRLKLSAEDVAALDTVSA
jgi:aryl-alcohol dehydrogenase-like predicted oxidoreductase